MTRPMRTLSEPLIVVHSPETEVQEETDDDLVSASESLTEFAGRAQLRSLSADDLTQKDNLTSASSARSLTDAPTTANRISFMNRSFDEEETEPELVESASFRQMKSPPHDHDNLSPSIVGRGACARVDVCTGADGTLYAEKTISTLTQSKASAAARELNFATRYFNVLASPQNHCGNPFCVNQLASRNADGSFPTPTSASSLVSRILAATVLKDDQKRHRVSCEVCPCTPQGIVRILAAYTEPSEHTMHLVMEYMDGGDAATAIAGPNTPSRVIAAVARQMMEGLSFIHDSMRGLHRDIKPENVLVSTTGRVALSDFGCSAVDDSNGDVMFSDQVGSILYMSPERLLGDAHGPASDVWSLGVTIAALATGRHPFVDSRAIHGSNERVWALAEVLHFTSDSVEECQRATEAAVTKALAARCDDDLTDFVHCCTWRRTSLSTLREHPFVRGLPVAEAIEVVRNHIASNSSTS